MSTHQLKTWPQYFEAVRRGDKTFEIRVNDRNYQVGDILELWEYRPDCNAFTDEMIERRVTYIAQGVFGLRRDVCVMGLEPYHQQEGTK